MERTLPVHRLFDWRKHWWNDQGRGSKSRDGDRQDHCYSGARPDRQQNRNDRVSRYARGHSRPRCCSQKEKANPLMKYWPQSPLLLMTISGEGFSLTANSLRNWSTKALGKILRICIILHKKTNPGV